MALFHFSEFFIMSQVTTTPPVTVLCYTTFNHIYNCYNGFHYYGQSNSFGSACCGFATTTYPRGHKEGCYRPHYCATATSLIPDSFSGLCHGSSLGEISFLSSASQQFLYVDVCYSVWCLLSDSDVVTIFTS